jgi:hypothetical protein
MCPGGRKLAPVVQGGKLTWGRLRSARDWYQVCMTVAVGIFFVWVNWVARSYALCTGQRQRLRQRRLKIQAKHRNGPVPVDVPGPQAGVAAGATALVPTQAARNAIAHLEQPLPEDAPLQQVVEQGRIHAPQVGSVDAAQVGAAVGLRGRLRQGLPGIQEELAEPCMGL